MAKLTSEVKRMIVQRLAIFDAPVQIQAELRAMGVDVSLPQIAYYDASMATEDLGPRWRTLFHETRSAFLKETTAIAISHKAVRLRRLGRIADKMALNGNVVMEMAALEQAAKEVGNVYSNRHELTGRKGKPMEADVRVAVGFWMPTNGREVNMDHPGIVQSPTPIYTQPKAR